MNFENQNESRKCHFWATFGPNWAEMIKEVNYMGNQMIGNFFLVILSISLQRSDMKWWFYEWKCDIYGYSLNNGEWGDSMASAGKTESDRILNFVLSNQGYMCHHLCKVSASWRTPIFYKEFLFEFWKSKWKPKMPFLSDFWT